MKLQFKNQAFQEAATAAVCDVFDDQPYHDPNRYTVDPGKIVESEKWKVESVGAVQQELQLTTNHSSPGTDSDAPDVGYANAPIIVPQGNLLGNLRAVQARQNLEPSDSERLFGTYAKPVSVPELDVEMETGTGKTFVYTKTIFELNKRYG